MILCQDFKIVLYEGYDMISLCIPNLKGNEKKYLNDCIETTYVSSVGPYVTKFEEQLEHVSGTNYAVATSAGTTALHITLVACGVQRDDLVIIPSYTFIATANAVSHCGATPLLVDVTYDDWTIDVDKIQEILYAKTIRSNNKLIYVPTGQKIAAIIPVYTLGNIAKMERLCSIANKFDIPVIADAAAAIGALYKGEPIGKLATASTFSFNGNKTITTGGGGAVITDNKLLAEKIRHLLSTARVGITYTHDEVGYNYRMTNIAAAVGCAQIEKLSVFVNRKKEIRQYYDAKLKDLPGVELFPNQLDDGVCWFSGLVLDSENAVTEMIEVLKQNEIESRTFWKPMHLQPPYQNCLKTDMSVCESFWNHVLTLPSSTGITNEELDKVIDVIKRNKS